MSQFDLTEFSHQGMSCTTASLWSFGVQVENVRSRTPREVQAILEANGYTVELVPVTDLLPVKRLADGRAVLSRTTLARFVRQHQDGDWIVVTEGHTMSLRGGKLTDTWGEGARKRVLRAYKVDKKSAPC